MFDAVVADIANHFLRHDLSLSQLALKFSRGLSSSYIEIHPTEFQQTAELLLMFLSEIDANEMLQIFCVGLGFFVSIIILKIAVETESNILINRNRKPKTGI